MFLILYWDAFWADLVGSYCVTRDSEDELFSNLCPDLHLTRPRRLGPPWGVEQRIGYVSGQGRPENLHSQNVEKT